jgi:hypothetical protein
MSPNLFKRARRTCPKCDGVSFRGRSRRGTSNICSSSRASSVESIAWIGCQRNGRHWACEGTQAGVEHQLQVFRAVTNARLIDRTSSTKRLKFSLPLKLCARFRRAGNELPLRNIKIREISSRHKSSDHCFDFGPTAMTTLPHTRCDTVAITGAVVILSIF